MIRIVKYNYKKYGSFEVKDSTNDEPCWIMFEEMRKPYEGANHEEYIPIQVEQGY